MLRVATEKLASAHMQVVGNFQDLIKELKEYGDKQKERHKQVQCLKFLLVVSLNLTVNYNFLINFYLKRVQRQW